MTTIKMTKTKRSNAVVSTIEFNNVDDEIYMVDSSDRNWRTKIRWCDGLNDAINFLKGRGYKFWLTDDGEYKSAYNLWYEYLSY